MSFWMDEETILGVFVPVLIVLFVAFNQLVVLVIPQRLRTAFAKLGAPWHNFLQLDDLEGPLGKVHTLDLKKTRILVVLTAIEGARWLTSLAFYASWTQDRALLPLITTHAVAAMAWTYTSAALGFKRSPTVPYLPLVLSGVLILKLVVDLGTDASRGAHALMCDILDMVVPVAIAWVAGSYPMKCTLPCPDVAGRNNTPSYNLSMPEDDVTLWQWFTVSFVEPLYTISNARTLDEADVWHLSPYFLHKNLFNRYLEYHEKHPSHSLLRFLLASNTLDLTIDVAVEFWHVFVGFLPAYALREILTALENDAPEARRTAYNWSLAVFMAHLSFAQVDIFQRWHTRRCYERTRGQLFCALHYKSLKRQDISGKVGADVKDSANLGKIVNLMQGDSYAVAQRFWQFSGFFGAPVRLVIALVFLYNVLGWSSLFSVVIVLAAYILNYPLATYNVYVTRNSWRTRDRRMSVVNELLQNIRFLKFYGWENVWARTAQKARDTELNWRIKENVVDTAISFIWTWMPSATALVAFMSYTLIAGEKLTVAKAFTSLALFSSLQEPMTALPGQFFALLNAYVSMQRIEQFLQEDEVPDWASTLTASAAPVQHDDVGFVNAVFGWNRPPQSSTGSATPVPQFLLGPFDFMFPKAKLSLISGPTGSGKSALLSALLGEMHVVSGSVQINKIFHQVAYCAQHPWLEHATIRDNIIFGSERGFDEERYSAVIDACALPRDLAVFDAGDFTEIGEKGITLSGGQRARIALARALYSEAKVILLDDVLAAVDMHTSRHLVNHCLTGKLAHDRTIILVTHHVDLCLPFASYIIELAHGQVVRHGEVANFPTKNMNAIIVESGPDDDKGPAVEDEVLVNEADGTDEPVTKRPVQPANGRLIEAEARAEGRVSFRTYLTYFRAAGFGSGVLTVVLMIFIRFINIINQFFLADWGDAYRNAETAFLYARTLLVKGTIVGYPWRKLPPPDEDVKPWLWVYLYVSTAGAFAVLFYIAIGYYASLQASRTLYTALLRKVTRARVRFFDTTPIGRILNRFTSDIHTIDGALQSSARACMNGVFNFLASFLVIILVIPSFTPFALVIAVLYIRLAPSYIQASRDLRRLESVSLSPAFAGFDELLHGIAHVRAFGVEGRYQNKFYTKVDRFQCFDHVYWLVNNWLKWRYDCLGSLVVFAATLFALWTGVTDGSTAIVIVQAGIFAEANRQLVQVAAQLELDFNSVERVVEYLDIPEEAPAIIEKHRPPAYWPSTSGGIVVENLLVRYAPTLPPVLKHLSFIIRPSEKIGVVSCMTVAVSNRADFVAGWTDRLGIDNIDISTIGLEDLRTRISSSSTPLPSGTIRSNIDPAGERPDAECLDVLERCHLVPLLQSRHAPEGNQTLLDIPVSHGSLSGGERQLVALTRAVLRKTSLIIMDEATSQVDAHLDSQIQATIRTELASCIVITIAHRLKTIVDYDRILVLDNGAIVEFDAPAKLLSKVGGTFREMCRKSPDWPTFQSLAAAQEG
ncbi:hypothetical protein FISHEDRAFT_64655 [Fistulina hepatica ATCC 64428]|uniref:P-loop containing nucleoside triphosphate hydrolase protein n=1 Tax=Fistulina hepatica ATCC 64428 TaxID=1128425 RepID=A0A0D7AG66_9AGAR|nr:hypothetical protein FISHEDRAFT_64655 [Fistulina hepatica ATCC 64428]